MHLHISVHLHIEIHRVLVFLCDARLCCMCVLAYYNIKEGDLKIYKKNFIRTAFSSIMLIYSLCSSEHIWTCNFQELFFHATLDKFALHIYMTFSAFIRHLHVTFDTLVEFAHFSRQFWWELATSSRSMHMSWKYSYWVILFVFVFPTRTLERYALIFESYFVKFMQVAIM